MVQAQLFSDKLALNITILHPDKLTYRVLFDMVRVFRHTQKKFPDIIEFTPSLMQRFKRDLGGEGKRRDKFLDIRCIIDPRLATSHNHTEAKSRG